MENNNKRVSANTTKKDHKKVPPKATMFRHRYDKLRKQGKAALVPIAILEDKQLSPQEKILFMQISSHSYSSGHCFASNDYLGEKLDVSGRQISTLAKGLIEKEYIKVRYEKVRNGTKRYMAINFKKIKEVTDKMEQDRKEWLEQKKGKDEHVDTYGRSIFSPYWNKENRKRK